MQNESKFNSRHYALLICSAMNHIISIFLTTFWIVHLTSNLSDIFFVAGVYYIIHYAFQLFFYQMCAKIFRENVHMREVTYRLGILVKCVFILAIALYADKLQPYYWLMGIFHGLYDGLYWSSFNVMKNSVLNNNVVKKYSAFDNVSAKTINVVVPILLGMLISKSTFYIIAFPIFIMSVIQFIASFFVKSPQNKLGDFSVKNFRKRVKNDVNYKAIRNIFLVNFMTGFRESVSTFISILIFTTLSGDKDLGSITSLGAVFAIITIIFYSSRPKMQTNKYTHISIVVLISIITALVVFLTKSWTIVLFSVSYTILTVMVDYGVDTNRICIMKMLGYQDDLSEFYADGEVYICLARIISFFLLVITGLLNNLLQNTIMVKISIIITVLGFITLTYFNYQNEIKLKNLIDEKLNSIKNKQVDEIIGKEQIQETIKEQNLNEGEIENFVDTNELAENTNI